jgi:endonuclease G
MKKILRGTMLAVALAVATLTQAAQHNKDCPQFFFQGAPAHETKQVNEGSYFLCKKAYAAQYYTGTKTSLWVAEKLEAAANQGDEPRTDEFVPDPQVNPRHSSTNKDYKELNKRLKSNGQAHLYDRGHLAPAGDFSNDKEAMVESFFLSNMVPQVNSHNQGIWRDLEMKVRQWARARGTLFVVTGPIFRNGKAIETLNGLAVPTDIYKLVVDPKTQESVAFVVPNLPFKYAKGGSSFERLYEYKNITYRMDDFILPIKDVESLTGINFHPMLSPEASKGLEGSKGVRWRAK